MSLRKAFVNISSAILGLTVMGGNVMAQDQKACKTAVEAFEAATNNFSAVVKAGQENKVKAAADRLGDTVSKVGDKCGLSIEDSVNLSNLAIVAMPGVAEQPGMADVKAKGDSAMAKARQAAGLTK